MLQELDLQPLTQAHKNTVGKKQALTQLPKTSAECRQTTGCSRKRHSLVFSTDGKKLLLKKPGRPPSLDFSSPQNEVN